jgi:sulfate permease, SulP family
VSLITLTVGVISLVPLLFQRSLAPKVPGPLLILVLGIVVSAALQLEDRGVVTVGGISSGLPEFAFPSAQLADVVALFPAALGIFFVSFSDAILTGRSFAGKHSQNVRGNQELLALGIANLAASSPHLFRSERVALGRPLTIKWEVAAKSRDSLLPEPSGWFWYS